MNPRVIEPPKLTRAAKRLIAEIVDDRPMTLEEIARRRAERTNISWRKRRPMVMNNVERMLSNLRGLGVLALGDEDNDADAGRYFLTALGIDAGIRAGVLDSERRPTVSRTSTAQVRALVHDPGMSFANFSRDTLGEGVPPYITASRSREGARGLIRALQEPPNVLKTAIVTVGDLRLYADAAGLRVVLDGRYLDAVTREA